MDTLGLPHAIHITPANVTDRKGAEQMIGLNINSLSAVKVFLVDGGYSGDKFANTIKKIHGATVKLVKRRLWKNCERYLHTSVQITSLAFIALLLNRF